MNKMLKKYFLQIIVIILLIGIAWVLILIRQPQSASAPDVQSLKPEQTASVVQREGDINIKNIGADYFPIRNWMVEEPQISAKAALVIDFKTGSNKTNILFNKNSGEKLPIASLSKIMTAIVALENLNPDEIIKVSKQSVFTDGNNGGLIIDEELTVKDLLYIMLIESSNDAAMALANDNRFISYKDFIKMLNDKTLELNMTDTYFDDPSGLSEKNTSTAQDMIKLIKYAMNSPLLLQIMETKEFIVKSADGKITHNLASTNQLLGKIPVILGGKTGYTDEAGGCMLTFSNIDGSYLITVVLGSKNREDDTEKLINWSQTAWLWQ